MDRVRRYSWMLREAADSIGGDALLARRLGVQPDQLARWLTEAEEAPLEVFMDALDVIADGMTTASEPMRVASIKDY